LTGKCPATHHFCLNGISKVTSKYTVKQQHQTVKEKEHIVHKRENMKSDGRKICHLVNCHQVLYSTTRLRLRNPTPVQVRRTLLPPNFSASSGDVFSEPS